MCGKRAEEPIPKPREMPTPGGFSLPHRELYDDTQRLLGQMRNAIRAAEERSATLRASGDEIRAQLALDDLEAQMYSRAIQVFAAMAAEAALNAYGLMWFGETDFERHFRWKNPVEKKLKALMRAVLGRELSSDDEIVRLLESLRRKRNAHVHPQAEESAFDAEGVVRTVTKDDRPRLHPSAGCEAAQEVHRFLELFAALDRRTTFFFAPLNRRSQQHPLIRMADGGFHEDTEEQQDNHVEA